MTNKEIKDIINLEKTHRYVFDKLYVQTYEIGTNKTDKAVLVKYKILIKKYPNFRQQCADVFISLYNLDESLSKLGKNLEQDDVDLFVELGKINFNRYGLEHESKLIIKKIKHEI